MRYPNLYRLLCYILGLIVPQPWRTPSCWDNQLEQKILADIIQVDQPPRRINVLLLGPVGAGKSSFINSILSIDNDRQCTMATPFANETSNNTWTTQLTGYTCENSLRGFRLFDCMGIGRTNRTGIRQEDLLLLVQGHIKEGYEFNQDNTITEDSEYYRPGPELKHQMHCVIFILDSTSINCTFANELKRKIEAIQRMLTRHHIPRILILSKIDKLCPAVMRDNTYMFWSIAVQKSIKRAHELFGIEAASIHPVTNFTDYNFTLDAIMKIPFLIAMKQAMHYAKDKIRQAEQQTQNDEDGEN